MQKPHDEWLAKAEDDLQFARVGLKEGFYSQVCTLAQQTIEKSLKGTLVARQRPYPKNHSLRELAKKLPELKLDWWMESLTIIDGYYVPLRYPDAAAGTKASGPPNEEEAKEALKTAEEIFGHVGAFLSLI
ncbi:MAG: HEPN domain-containing protein [Deltaproteobacteria bacterium]|nr:HEPN domain-containing protein [Deltaproteobacteria bacterium]MBI4223391.1 HEPN domain-containing protein [Deltaproteobacteria bacterium]